MSTRADIIDLPDNATEDMPEKILASAKEIVRSGKGDKVYTIDEIKAKAIPIAKKYGVKRLSLFGSYARSEADAQSDLDFFYACASCKSVSLSSDSRTTLRRNIPELKAQLEQIIEAEGKINGNNDA